MVSAKRLFCSLRLESRPRGFHEPDMFVHTNELPPDRLGKMLRSKDWVSFQCCDCELASDASQLNKQPLESEVQFEKHIRKLLIDKQELQWQKESLQYQSDMAAKEHKEALITLRKQFQERISGIEGDKGKYQLSAGLKEKEISGLKEEFKKLQLSNYSLQKKLSELEQKLQLQNATKDSHLIQLSKAEKRYKVIIHQFGLIKQAHEKLELNVEEAMHLNKKLTTINKNQEATIQCLKQEIENKNKELIKSRVTITCRKGEENSILKGKEQCQQELQLKIKMVH
ncbi:coiled-coil domain-containing protein 73-like [Polypterus senegalus]|uniref:coiled-coil domain-containing protein 73-like n=1 Tax=Polypterus senegalus TaxID=55291 RepID=UPI0019651DAA|nr:coiled-coil domain-containing protein 73-like [Polypterus senegalus]